MGLEWGLYMGDWNGDGMWEIGIGIVCGIEMLYGIQNGGVDVGADVSGNYMLYGCRGGEPRDGV